MLDPLPWLPWMRRALQLAALGQGRTSPNPMVGALVLGADGSLVGEGYHARAGEPHAEVGALAQAGDRARGGTLVVTLEPCCHHGRTPPCTEAVISAGIARVVVAMEDPNPLGAGGGLERLRAAGLEVISGVAGEQALALNAAFVHHPTPNTTSRASYGRTSLAWLATSAASPRRESAKRASSRLRSSSNFPWPMSSPPRCVRSLAGWSTFPRPATPWAARVAMPA